MKFDWLELFHFHFDWLKKVCDLEQKKIVRMNRTVESQSDCKDHQ